MRRILDIVKLSKVEACFLFVKIALFSLRYSGAVSGKCGSRRFWRSLVMLICSVYEDSALFLSLLFVVS